VTSGGGAAFTLSAIQNAVNDSNWIDATTSQDLQVDLFTLGSDEYNFWSGKDTTVAGYFQKKASVKAEAAQPGTPLQGNIYFDPNYVNSRSSGYDAALLMHEALHTIGPVDSALLAALGFKATDATQYITDKLAKDCFGTGK
jgi:hypothetical protein